MARNAKLRFFFGTMGSGKSTQALQIHHNLSTRGLDVMLVSQLDRESGRVSSRLGVSAEAVIVTPESDLLGMARAQVLGDGLDAMVCDEAQFYAPEQIEQLAQVVDLLSVDVFAFGLLTSFQGQLFPGTARLLELADERSELQVEARCYCGQRATHNARLVDGRQVYAGALKVVGDTNDRSEAHVTYELRCRMHWHQELWSQQGRQLQLPVDHGADVIDLKIKAVARQHAEHGESSGAGGTRSRGGDRPSRPSAPETSPRTDGSEPDR